MGPLAFSTCELRIGDTSHMYHQIQARSVWGHGTWLGGPWFQEKDTNVSVNINMVL